MNTIKNTGLILDNPQALSELPQAELILGAPTETKEAPDWTKLVPTFRNQGPTRYCTAFAGSNIASIFEKLEHGDGQAFSPAELFFRSNGNLSGNSLINTALAMRESVVLEKDVPTIIPDGWGSSVFNSLKKKSIATPDAIDRGRLFRMKDVAVVNTDKEMLKTWVAKSPILCAIGLGAGYWNDPAPVPKKYNDFHANVLLGFDQGKPVVFESISGYPNFGGLKHLAEDYEILYGIMFTDLPVDWKLIQDELRGRDFQNALAHYGEPRNYLNELTSSRWIAQEIKKHPTLSVYFAKEWTVAVNAYVYGGYSLQDLLNHFTSIRRGGGAIFNLNNKRS
jgi:hypothetical protein